jgi:hypothetical protein
MAELQLPKLVVRVRFPSPAQIPKAQAEDMILDLGLTKESAERKRGTLKLRPDGSALVITWDGPAWGGMIDSLKRTG